MWLTRNFRRWLHRKLSVWYFNNNDVTSVPVQGTNQMVLVVECYEKVFRRWKCLYFHIISLTVYSIKCNRSWDFSLSLRKYVLTYWYLNHLGTDLFEVHFNLDIFYQHRLTKSNHVYVMTCMLSMGWNRLTIPKLQPLRRWRLVMDK